MAMQSVREYHFTDEQIDNILRLVRNQAFKLKQLPEVFSDMMLFDFNELANTIEDQIVNHPTND